jgi:hypothetical protein
MGNEISSLVSQRSIAGGAVFRFNEDHLAYFGKEWDFKTKYQDIAAPSQYRRGTTTDRIVRFTFIYLLILGFVLLSRDHDPHYGTEGWHWLLASMAGFVVVLIAVCWLLYYFTHRDYTLIPTANGSLMVFRDNKHDAILQRVQSGRLKGLRSLSAPNSANSPTEELAKLKFLRDEGAITEDEYNHLCSQVSPFPSNLA